MSQAVEKTQSLWMATASVSARSPLTDDTVVDVCIVGAGVAGLTTAYLLAQAGRSVVLLDDGPVAGGQSQRTTAHLSNALDDRYFEVEKIHGEDGSRLAAESHSAAIDKIESVVKLESIDCDFTRLDGYLFLAPGESRETLDRELAAARRAGLKGLEIVERAPLTSFDTGPCLRFPRQAQFHPLKYFAGLASAVERLGGRIYCGTHVSSIEGGNPAKVTTKNGRTVHAQAVVVATNTPINDLLVIHTKQAPYLTYAISAEIPAGSVPKALYWDTLDPYHYIRTQPASDGKDMLVVGGEDHKSGQAKDQAERWDRLESWARERFPMMGQIKYRWSGMVMETTDGLAFIGPNPGDENVYIATGDSGMGMTHGTIAGMLLTDLIQVKENPWSKLYDPSRKPVWGMAWKDYVRENANVAREYVKDWLGGSEVASLDEIPKNSGAVMRDGLSKTAVFRDQQGELHKRSAICPHLGCIVHWNGAENTWDCPCHGSRFDPLGQVICGPANQSLAEKGSSGQPPSAKPISRVSEIDSHQQAGEERFV
jgi:glycine/D-amino acid oxidase-like deaminating enzyme/nitrite reductase/ring-hydroxylating ferredoxin subunit